MSPRIVPGQVWRWMTDDEVVLGTVRVAGEPWGENVPVQRKLDGDRWSIVQDMRLTEFGARFRLFEDVDPKRKGGL